MIRNPALRDVPLGKLINKSCCVCLFFCLIRVHKCFTVTVLPGIQQKYIVVTCNYVARERGVTKLMSVTDAKEKCPELVLVKGEDLTHYREMSYKVTGMTGNQMY